MNDREELDDMQKLWTSAPPEGLQLDMDALRSKAVELDGALRRRNGVEVFAAGALAAMALGLAIVVPLWLVKAGLVLMAVGAGFVARSFVTQGRAHQELDATVGTDGYLAGYRAELVHQIALLESVPRWYLGPLVPGYVVMGLGMLLEPSAGLFEGQELMAQLWWAATYYGGGAAGFAAVAWINRRAAKTLREQLDALDP